MIFIWLFLWLSLDITTTLTSSSLKKKKKKLFSFWNLLNALAQNEESASSPCPQRSIQCLSFHWEQVRISVSSWLNAAEEFSPSAMIGSTFQPVLCEQSQRARSNRARIRWGFKAKLFPLKCQSTTACQQHRKPWQEEIESFLLI